MAKQARSASKRVRPAADRIIGILLFLPVPLVLWLFTALPWHPLASLGAGIVLMATHVLYARPWALRRSHERCLWCAGPTGPRGSASIEIAEPRGPTEWIACSATHDGLLSRTLGWAGRHQRFVRIGILGAIGVLLAGVGVPSFAPDAPFTEQDAVAAFRIVVAAVVLPLSWIGPRRARGDGGALVLESPFPVHIQALIGTRWVLWLFRVIGLWWAVLALRHAAARIAGSALVASALILSALVRSALVPSGLVASVLTASSLAMSALVVPGLVASAVAAAAPAGAFDWSPVASPTTQRLEDVTFADPVTAWAVGARGTVLRSTDAGANWELRPSLGSGDLHEVVFVSPRIGMIVGLTAVYRTTDGGGSWTRLVPHTSGQWTCLEMVDERTAFVGGNSTWSEPWIALTTDGGESWEIESVDEIVNISTSVRALAFITPQDGFAAVPALAGWLLRTRDGGRTWETVRADAGRFYTVLDASAPLRLIAAGHPTGTTLFTTDRGRMWMKRDAPGAGAILGAAYGTEPEARRRPAAIVVGGGGFIAWTDDDGFHWKNDASGTDADLHGVSLSPAGFGVAVGSGGTILRSAPGM